MFINATKRISGMVAAIVLLFALHVPLLAQPDVAITAVPSTPNPITGVYAYTEVTVQNIGSVAATNVSVQDFYPVELNPGAVSFVSGQVASTVITGLITYATLAPGATSVYRFYAKPKCHISDGAPIVNPFTSSADVDADLSNNNATALSNASNPVPVFTSFPSDITTTTGPGATVCGKTIADLGLYTVTDNCTGTSVALTGVPAGNVFPVGVTVVTYTATDAGGAQTIATQNVTVSDDTPPLPDVDPLPDVYVSVSVPVPTVPTATDNCAGALAASTSDPLSYGTPGTYVVTWTYDDGNGNTSVQTQNVIATVPDIAVTVSPSTLNPVTGVYYYTQVTIQNIGTEAAINVSLTDSYSIELTPGAVSYVSGQVASTVATGVITYASMPAGATSVYRFYTKVKCYITDGAPVSNTFTATAAVDYDLSNNIGTTLVNASNPAPVFATFPADINTTTGVGATTCDAFIPSLGAYTVTDNCTGTNVVLTGVPAGNFFPVGTTVITYTATDAGGRQTIQTQNISVSDDTPPVPDVSVLPDLTVSFTSSVTTYPTATDNCDGAMTGTTTDPLSYATPGTYVVTWTYDDGNGNIVTQTQNIIVTAPDVTISVIPGTPNPITGSYFYMQVTLQNIGTEAATNVVVRDYYPVELNPGAVSYVSGQTATTVTTGMLTYASVPAGATSVYRFYVKPKCHIGDGAPISNPFDVTSDVDYDMLNNSATVLVNASNPAPVFATFPADISITTGPGATTCDAIVASLGAYSVTDNCTGSTVAITGVPAGNIYPLGVTVVTYTATDAGGAQTVQTQNVTVSDDTPPVPNVAVLSDLTISFNTPITTFPTATDNCAGSVTGTTSDPLIYANPGTYLITWTYDDGNGNTTTQVQNVIVTIPDVTITAVPSTTNPVTGVYAYTEVTIENIGNEAATNVAVHDYYAIELNPGAVSYVSGQTATTVTTGTLTYATLAPGTTSVYRFYAKPKCHIGDGAPISNNFDVTADADYDMSNNTATTLVTASNPSPVFATFPADINVTTGPGALTCDALVADLGAYTITDNCTGSTVALTGIPAGNIFPFGTTVVTYTATDAGGAQTVQTQNVTVGDDTPPVPDIASLPAYTNECAYTVTTAPTATDNCAGALTATTTQSLPWTFDTQGTFTMTWTYDDGNGNTSTQDQLVIIDDITSPVADVTTLPDLTAECAYTIGAAPTATDNCTGTITGTTTDPLSYSAQGTFIVTWSYDDGNGNVSTQPQTVIIDDITAPVPNVASLPVVTGECNATVTAVPTATDNCVGIVNGTTSDPLTYAVQGTYTVTWTYNDGNGNASTQLQTVIVDDITAPVPNVASLPNVTGQCSATVTVVPTATDACVGSVTGMTTDPLTYTQQGTFYVTWSYNDGNGNISTQIQTVIVDDITAPVVICAAGTIVEADANGQAQVPNYMTGSSATDNCSSPANLVWTQVPASGSYVGSGLNTITVYATDEAGNLGSCTTVYEVVPRVSIETNPDAARIAFGCSSPLSFTRSVSILNGGGHYGSGIMEWNASTSASAITITNAAGNEGDAMLFTVNPAGLLPGTYLYSITITAFNSATRAPASNSPYSFQVQVIVEPVYGGSISQTKPVGTSWTQFTNTYGHVFAEVKSNGGSISSFTVTAYPCSHPVSIPMVNYVNRYFNFSAAGSVNVDIRTYFTDTEKMPRVVQPQNLVLYQQPISGGAWFNRGGVSNVAENYVELTGVTALSGNWLPAHPWVPWFPKTLALRITGTSFNRQTRVIGIDWHSLIETGADGFSVERCYGSDPESGNWYEAGLIGFNPQGNYTFAEPVQDLGAYHYRISTWDKDGNYYASQIITIEASDIPGDYALGQNYPNPFNPETVISYTIPNQETVSLKVYDMFWKEVKTLSDGIQQAGSHEVRFNAANLPSGTYFYQLKAGTYTMTRKMNLTK